MVPHRTRIVAALGAVVVATVGLAGCGGSSAGGGSAGVTLSLVAYSTPQAAYTKLIAAFKATPEGRNVTFKQSYGASGDQSRAVQSGLKADVVEFSLEPDMTRLVKANLVDASWNTDQYKGFITDSVVVLATRKGNPKNIRTWDDLLKPGIDVITPNPFASGSARWNIMAAYGAKSSKGTDQAAGLAYLTAMFPHVSVQDTSGRAATQTFVSGKGDVLISYENEAIAAQQNGQPVDYVIPDQTILIENPIAVTKNSAHPAEAKAFVAFLHTPQAQKIFADNGYRPVVQGVGGPSFATPPHLFTINDLGGWSKVQTQFFDPDKGLMVPIEARNGVSSKTG
ncbi:MAG: sulfate ABC transporter substrate-binding protein [Micromonosporaceae bacterium]|nr:sulfate ABC transporter substrate-binding protein [Micromonosporaceae bacterium]